MKYLKKVRRITTAGEGVLKAEDLYLVQITYYGDIAHRLQIEHQ